MVTYLYLSNTKQVILEGRMREKAQCPWPHRVVQKGTFGAKKIFLAVIVFVPRNSGLVADTLTATPPHTANLQFD